MKCRTTITGRKIWLDDNNQYNTRPPFIEVELSRDGTLYKTVTLDSSSDGIYKFPCLIIWKNANEKYVYTVDEPTVPDGYTKTIQGYNIVNTLNDMPINGLKIWEDNNNAEGLRPADVTVHLFQNGIAIDSIQVPSPADNVDRVEFSFGIRPYADPQGLPYVYMIQEDSVDNYETTIDGFVITNTFIIVP